MRSQRVKRIKRSKKSKMLKRKQINRRTKRVSRVKRSKRSKRSRRSQINRGTRRTRRNRRMRGGSNFKEKKLLEQSHLTPAEMDQYKTHSKNEIDGAYGTTRKKATTERRRLDALAKQRLKAAGEKMGPHEHSDPPQPTTEHEVSSALGLEDLSDLTSEEMKQIEQEFELLGSGLDTPVEGGARPPETLPETQGVLGGSVEPSHTLTRGQRRRKIKAESKETRKMNAFQKLFIDNKWRVPKKKEAADKNSGNAIMGKIIWISNKSLNSSEDINENPAIGKVGRVTEYNSKLRGPSSHTIEGVQELKSEESIGRLGYSYYDQFDPESSDPRGEINLYRSSKEKVTTSKKYPFLIKCEGDETPSTLEEIRNWIENGEPWPPLP